MTMTALPPAAMPVPSAGTHPPQARREDLARGKTGKLRRRFAAVLPSILFILAWSLPGLMPALAGLAWLCGAGH